jgi:hypothetical protein
MQHWRFATQCRRRRQARCFYICSINALVQTRACVCARDARVCLCVHALPILLITQYVRNVQLAEQLSHPNTPSICAWWVTSVECADGRGQQQKAAVGREQARAAKESDFINRCVGTPWRHSHHHLKTGEHAVCKLCVVILKLAVMAHKPSQTCRKHERKINVRVTFDDTCIHIG